MLATYFSRLVCSRHSLLSSTFISSHPVRQPSCLVASMAACMRSMVVWSVSTKSGSSKMASLTLGRSVPFFGFTVFYRTSTIVWSISTSLWRGKMSPLPILYCVVSE